MPQALGLIVGPLVALTLVLPEPTGRSLEDIAADTPAASVQPLRVADQASAS